MTDAPPLTLQEQAELLSRLIGRFVRRDGGVARETWMPLDSKDYADLMHLETRLRRMAPFEREIKRVVTKR